MKIKFNKASLGFTMAEILISLGLVGIIAAMVVPALINTLPSQNKVMFKKAYSTTERIIFNMINDDTSYPGNNTTNPGFSNTENVTGGNGTTADKFCYYFANQLNIISGGCGTGTTNTFTTSDGIVWTINDTTMDTTNTNYSIKIGVNVNGVKKPNCYTDSSYNSGYFNTTYFGTTPATTYSSCTSAVADPCDKNPDVFIFGIRADGKIQVGGASNSDACATNILSNPTTLK